MSDLPGETYGRDKHTIPENKDMIEVVYWSGRCAELTEQLFQAQECLRDAWKKIPADTEILRNPYRADIAVTCHICGRPTHWRTGKGLAQCNKDCAAKVGSRTLSKSNVSEEVWDLINAIVEKDESLDDDE